jgi:type II secretory ATPase GspE/PulE/Tfp pilus assembly ATPase PilB-like protein
VDFLRGGSNATRLFSVDPEAVRRIPAALALRYDVLGLEGDDNSLAVAVPDPNDREPIERLRYATGMRVHAVAAPREVIRRNLTAAYGVAGDAERADDPPVVRLWDDLQRRAVAERASDLHLEREAGGGRVRLRVDGILRDVAELPCELFDRLVARVKLLSAMDITDRRRPQDGRLRATIDGRDLDARVASLPLFHGDSVVVRFASTAAGIPSLDVIGLNSTALRTLRSELDASHGCVLVCGPTGSGKTTTLYSAIRELSSDARRICSIEDPVEIELPRVAQIAINQRAGLTFDAALRAVVRQDPEVIMIGEIRDPQTARAVAAASLAGRLLLSSLHAAGVLEAMDRLVELGLGRRSIAAAIRCIVAQRLVRLRCRCRPRATGSTGCTDCSGSGYSGRTGVFEVLAIDEELQDAIASGAGAHCLTRLLRHRHFVTLSDATREAISAGITDAAEAASVFGKSFE